ncbi:MAG: DUF6542 domain-containing protein [Trebonia sp.]
MGTVATHRDPGFFLGFMIIVGSCIAALCIRRKSIYLLIPVPALTYLVLAAVVGYIHDRSMGTATTTLATDSAQWLGGGFAGICLATILVLLILGIRLLMSRQLVSGQFQMSAQRSSNGRFPRAPMAPPARTERAPRRDRAPWDDPDPWNDRGGRGDATRVNDAPRGDGSRGDGSRGDGSRGGAPSGDGSRGGGSRGGRDRRDERDAWYEQPRSGSRGRGADNDQQRTQAMPPNRQQPQGRGPNRDVPPGRAPRRSDDDRWRG